MAPTVTKRQEIVAFALVTSLFFLWGFSYGLLDVLNKHFQDFFKITKLQSTAIQVTYFGAYFVMSVPAGQFMTRFGYKNGVFLGLALYSTGALCFWPSAHFETFGGFVASAFVIASGLATLETAANSYIAVLGSQEQAAFRLNFAQSFNGLASFVGPLIASKYFFSDGNDKSLYNVQFVYLAVALLGVAIAILFFFATLPEITEEQLEMSQSDAGFVDDRPLHKRMHVVFGFIVQFCYVGAQVTVASFVINYLTDTGSYTSAAASQLFAYMQITFMAARFISTPLLRYFDPATLLVVYGSMCTVFSLVAATTGGTAGLASLYIIFFFESIIYPTTFTLATQNTGKLTKRAAGFLCMGVAGGAVFPPMQGALADSKGTIVSYVIPMVGFATVAAYGIGMRRYNANFKQAIAAAALELGQSDSNVEKDIKA